MAINITSANRKNIGKTNYNRNDNNSESIIIYSNRTPKIRNNNNNNEIRKINKFAFSNLYQNLENLSVINNYYNFKIIILFTINL